MTDELATSRGADFGQGTESATTLSAAADNDILIVTIPRGATRLFFEIKNVGPGPSFDAFTIQRRPHGSADWETLASVAGDYSSPQLPILEVQGAPVTLANGAAAFIRMDVEGTDAVRLAGSAAPALATYDLHYRIQ